jgi:hypothetical protein
MKHIIHSTCLKYSASFLLVLFSTTRLLANNPTQDLGKTVIAFDIKHSSLKEAFRQIESQTKFFFTFKTDDVRKYADLSFSSPGISLDKLLKILLTGTDLDFQQMKNNIIIKKISQPGETTPQKVNVNTDLNVEGGIHGRVTNEQG